MPQAFKSPRHAALSDTYPGHVETRTHRAALMDVETDDYCAPEGGLHPHEWRNNQGRPIAKQPRMPRATRFTPWFGIVVLVLAIVGALIAAAMVVPS